MKKPSRRRGPLLRPLPLRVRLSCFTRFHLSNPHALPLRIGKRARQIRRSAPMGNVSKQKRGRSRGIPGRNCQTLTSSCKVESASMSNKCEIQLHADPIQGASGGPRQASNFEATHRAPSSRPPLDLLNIPDEFKNLEMDRLLPCDLKNASSSAMQQYDAYLQWFYSSHRGPVPVASLADTASKYLEEEKSMKSLWVNSHACSNVPDAVVADCIYNSMDTVIKEKGEIEHPFAFDAAECLSKEAELITEWLRHGRCIFTDDEYKLCHSIRVAAAVLFVTRRKPSFHISAALLGIKKEAEWLIENLKRNSGESVSTSMKIRQFALDFVWEKFNELEPYYGWGNEELRQVETASESDDDESDDEELSEVETASESDDDVADNNYLGGCCDEAYMIPYC